jgi:hypothetical protein
MTMDARWILEATNIVAAGEKMLEDLYLDTVEHGNQLGSERSPQICSGIKPNANLLCGGLALKEVAQNFIFDQSNLRQP